MQHAILDSKTNHKIHNSIRTGGEAAGPTNFQFVQAAKPPGTPKFNSHKRQSRRAWSELSVGKLRCAAYTSGQPTGTERRLPAFCAQWLRMTARSIIHRHRTKSSPSSRAPTFFQAIHGTIESATQASTCPVRSTSIE